MLVQAVENNAEGNLLVRMLPGRPIPLTDEMQANWPAF